MNPFQTDSQLDPFSNNTNIDPFSSNSNIDPFSNDTNIDPFSNNTNIDPFSNDTGNDTSNIENSDLLKESQYVELWVSDRGRKFDTYISHLPYTKSELDLHLKNLKKKLGCGGSIQNSKDFEDDESINEYFRIHIQGNHKNYINEYFTKLGIKNIRVKG